MAGCHRSGWCDWFITKSSAWPGLFHMVRRLLGLRASLRDSCSCWRWRCWSGNSMAQNWRRAAPGWNDLFAVCYAVCHLWWLFISLHVGGLAAPLTDAGN
jgi:hypothetical protein